MFSYILRRLLLIIPTLLGILTINFFIIQAAPGGPVEQMIARLESTGESATVRVAGSWITAIGLLMLGWTYRGIG